MPSKLQTNKRFKDQQNSESTLLANTPNLKKVNQYKKLEAKLDGLNLDWHLVKRTKASVWKFKGEWERPSTEEDDSDYDGDEIADDATLKYLEFIIKSTNKTQKLDINCSRCEDFQISV